MPATPEISSLDRFRGCLRKLMKLVGYRAVACGGAASCISDPMGGVAIDRADRLIADHKRPNVPPRFMHVFLNVERPMVKRAERDFVLEERFGRVPIVDARSVGRLG